MIARESDSTEPDKLAEENGVYAIGYNAISSEVAPNAVLTAPIWDWGVYYAETVKAAMEGKWETHAYWGRMADNILKLAPSARWCRKPCDEVNAAKAKIISGELHPFTGPIADQSGAIRVAAGATMSDPISSASTGRRGCCRADSERIAEKRQVYHESSRILVSIREDSWQ